MEDYRPEVWKTMSIDFNGSKKKFIFQEIPESSYDEILNKLLYGFCRDETTSSSLNVINDPISMLKFQKFWQRLLLQRISIGVFELKENDELKLAGVNILASKNMKSEVASKPKPNECLSKVEKISNFLSEVTVKSNVGELFGDQNFLTSEGLYIYHEYRGLGLAKELLKLRPAIGKKYNIKYTKTLFTSEVSQTLAESVGFITVLTYDYKDALDDEMKPLFPSLEGKSIKCMFKQLF